MSDLDEKRKQSGFSASSMSYLDGLYELYLSGTPDGIPPDILARFRDFNAGNSDADCSHQSVIAMMRASSQHEGSSKKQLHTPSRFFEQLCEKVIDWFENNGHYYACTGMHVYGRLHEKPAKINWDELGVSTSDWSRTLPECLSVPMPHGAVFSDLVQALEKHYQSSIGYEYGYVVDVAEKRWIRENIWRSENLSVAKKKSLYRMVYSAEAFEKYLGRRYVGQKRFSLEGSESFIVALEQLIDSSVVAGVNDVVVGMAHRGRLNTMVNVLGLPIQQMDGWFQGVKGSDSSISGDVKYHLGYSSDRVFSGQSVHISLGFNPSHLESIVPVTMGACRARQDKVVQRSSVLPVLVHGDASFIGQGVVAESLNMSYVPAYDVRGSIHIVINNQIGFTTLPDDSRSSYYCTDTMKSIRSPVLHVNGDDPEAVCRAAMLAADYRNRFQKDIMIDIYSYRRHGHNEADEPMATSPNLYQAIKTRPSCAQVYRETLLKDAVCSQSDLDLLTQEQDALMRSGDRLIDLQSGIQSPRELDWFQYSKNNHNHDVDTAVKQIEITALGKKLTKVPDGFDLQKQVAAMVVGRANMFQGEQAMNWGAAEALSFASLLAAGVNIRLVGQDSCRGTFSHRHALWHDQNTGEQYNPYADIAAEGHADFSLYNSTLSEFAAVGFEYGYSCSAPKGLVLWEAQFGDFSNGAQVIIDQYLTSAWQKWGRMSGLVMLLPHGYEGQGPEHSSCRIERYLQMCAQNNIQVCVPSTPSQYFHLLRRQALGMYRMPLICVTPKSLLRHPKAVSTLAQFTQGCFASVLDDACEQSERQHCRRLVLCTGKVYYDLIQERESTGISDVAICRLEQLYPFPAESLQRLLAQYVAVKDVVWCQEEPKNQGGWYVLKDKISACLMDKQRLSYAGRSAMAAPATGNYAQHLVEQADVSAHALGIGSHADS